MQAFRLGNLSKRKSEIQVSHNCFGRTLSNNSNESFNEVTRGF